MSTKSKNNRQIEKETPTGAVISHIAFIMDGNGRWAKAKGWPRHKGHQEGFKRVKEIASACRDLGIKCMSLYAFSTENWKRPQEEIDFLFHYLDKFLKQELKQLLKDDCRFYVSGDISKLPNHSQTAIKQVLDATAHCQTFALNICLNYGSQQEIIRAIKQIVSESKSGKMEIEDMTVNTFEKYLYTAPFPPIDLLVRTSGEVRLSNFMLYQLAYSEMIFTKTTWPDFTKQQLLICLEEFKTRNRRYGGLARE